jgi:hypothetical protein
MTPFEKGALIWLIFSGALIANEWLRPCSKHNRLRAILVIIMWVGIDLIMLAFWYNYLVSL